MHVLQQLEVFINEFRTGKRADSVISSDSLSITGKEAWRQLRRELRSVGISHETFSQHRNLIKATLEKATMNEQLWGDIDFDLQNIEDIEYLGHKGRQDRPQRSATNNDWNDQIPQEGNRRPLRAKRPSWDPALIYKAKKTDEHEFSSGIPQQAEVAETGSRIYYT